MLVSLLRSLMPLVPLSTSQEARAASGPVITRVGSVGKRSTKSRRWNIFLIAFVRRQGNCEGEPGSDRSEKPQRRACWESRAGIWVGSCRVESPGGEARLVAS